MKLISFFSKFTLICNIAFLLFMIFSKLESTKPATSGSSDMVQTIPFFKDLVIILGFSAILINFLMCLVYVVILAIRKKHLLPKWLAPVNFVFLLVQIYFFFLR